MKTTLKHIWTFGPCDPEEKLADLGLTEPDDREVSLIDVLDKYCLQDALWCTRCFPEHKKLWIKYAVWCARQVQNLMINQRSIYALDVAWGFSNGEVSVEKLQDAKKLATAAAVFADAAANADVFADAAVYVTAATKAATNAAIAVTTAIADAAVYTDADAIGAKQIEKFRQIIEKKEWVD